MQTDPVLLEYNLRSKFFSNSAADGGPVWAADGNVRLGVTMDRWHTIPGIAKRHPAISVIFLILVLLGIAGAWIGFPTFHPPREAHDDRAFRIATANINFANPKPDEVTERLIGLRADILVVLECGEQNLSFDLITHSGLRPVLVEPQDGTHGICVFSSPEYSTKTELTPAPYASRCAMPVGTLRINANGTWISILGFHAPPPVAVCEGATAPTLDALASWIDRGRLRLNVGAGKKGDPVVVAGDFNALPFSKEIKRFKALGFTLAQDSTRFRQVGTWSPSPWIPKAARIDYILIPTSMTPIDAWVVGLPGSDHRALITDVSINPRTGDA